MTEFQIGEQARQIVAFQNSDAISYSPVVKMLAKHLLLAHGELDARRRGVYRISAATDWFRAAGDAVCSHCGLDYREHYSANDEHKILTRLCDGCQVKL